jgi:two-component system, sensor histidine kinase
VVELRAATLLNVNDTEASRHLVSRSLEMAGHRLAEAGPGGEALRLPAEQLDRLLTDF